MTKEENHQPQVSLETSPEEAQVKEPAATVEKLPNVNSQILCQIIEKSTKDELKALGRLMIVTINWKFPELSQRK